MVLVLGITALSSLNQTCTEAEQSMGLVSFKPLIDLISLDLI